MNRIFLVFLAFFCFSCEKLRDGMGPDSGNFPDGGNWETAPPSSLGITDQELKDLREMLTKNNSRAFLLLKDGKIVVEEYFGKELTSTKDFHKGSYWYWASAGKTLTAFTVGMAQEKGHLKLSQKTSDFLGKGWTSMSSEKENLITIRHQLTMTSGMDIKQDADCWKPECLKYVADAGTRWDYHNAPYTLLDQVVSKATDEKFDDFFNENLRDKIGMDGFWQYAGDNHVYFSTPRSMARFGLLILNGGEWNGVPVMTDKTYFKEMISTSQNLNASYGYLWWLNGHKPTLFPGIPLPFNRWITPNAPDEMIAAMGKNGQLLNIIPSQNLIVVRMGDASDEGQVGLQIQEDIWNLLNQILD